MVKPVITTRAGKGSALTWTEGDTNLENLRDATVSIKAGSAGVSVVADLNSELTLVAGTNITLTGDNTAKTITIAASGGGITDLVQDTTPQLGGNLDVNGNSITSASNGNINISPNGSGNINLTPATGHVTISAVNFPTGDGSANQVLKTDGAGQLSWATVSASPAGSNQQIQFNNSGSFGASSNLYYDGVSLKVTSGNIESLYSNGDEGGEFRLATAQTNNTLSGGSVVIDINQNQLRFFESGGSNRGAYINLANAGAGVSTNLLAGGGIASVSADTAPSLGGDLDIKDFKIKSTGVNGYITVEAANTQYDEIRMHSGFLYLGHTATTSAALTIGTFAAQTMVIGPNQGGYSTIQIIRNANGAINLMANGTGKVTAQTATFQVGQGDAAPTVTTNGAYGLTINTNNGTTSGAITLATGANGNIGITPNGTGVVNVQTTANGASSLQLGYAGEVRFGDSDNSNYVGFKSPATVSANKIWTLPAADGTSGQVLSTNGSGALSWATAGGGNNIIVLSCGNSNGVSFASTANTAMTNNWTLHSTGGISGVSVSTNTFTLPAGTYQIIFPMTTSTGGSTKAGDWHIRNNTDSTTLATFSYDSFTLGGLTIGLYGQPSYSFTIASSKTYTLRTTTAVGSTWGLQSGHWSAGYTVQIIKTA